MLTMSKTNELENLFRNFLEENPGYRIECEYELSIDKTVLRMRYNIHHCELIVNGNDLSFDERILVEVADKFLKDGKDEIERLKREYGCSGIVGPSVGGIYNEE